MKVWIRIATGAARQLALAREQWLILATSLLLAIALASLLYRDNLQSAAWIGDFVGGFASALAFAWLIASFRLQSKEIRLQRKELELQRRALENQAVELRNSARFSSLSQIGEILERAAKRAEDNGFAHPSRINIALYEGMAKWKLMLDTDSAELYQREYMEWSRIEGAARSYLASIAMALRIYLEFHTEVKFSRSDNDEEFIYIHDGWMRRAPYLSEHESAAHILSHFIFTTSPGLKALQLGHLVAMNKLAGKNVVRKAAFEQLKAELEVAEVPLPTIARGFSLS